MIRFCIYIVEIVKGEREIGNAIVAIGLLVRMMKDKKMREEIEVMHIATVECHSFQCLCDACCL